MNLVILTGRVGQDPEVKHLNENSTVANFSLATSKSYKNKEGERVEATQWHRIVAWRHNAMLAEKYIVKGTQLAITGSIEYREYTDANGVKKYSTEIIASDIELLGKKGDGGESNQSKKPLLPEYTDYTPNVPNNENNVDDLDDVVDLPF